MPNDPDMAEAISDTYSDCAKRAEREAADFADGLTPAPTDAELTAAWAQWAKSKKNTKVYTPSRTMRLLHMSRHMLRVIQGNVGCLSGDTEIMTPGGWVPISRWKGEDILQWNPSSGMCSFHEPTKYIKAPAGRMIGFRNQHTLSMVLSPNHRVPVYNWNGEFCVKTAEHLAKRPSKNVIPTSWIPATQGVNMTDDQLRLWVAVAADGCYPKRGNQCVFCFSRQRKKDRIRELLSRLNIPWVEFVHSCRPTETVFTIQRPDFPKHLDWRLSQITRNQANVIVDETSHWDGLHGYSYDRFSSTDKRDVDIIQYAAACAGRTGGIFATPGREKGWKTMFNVYPAKIGSAKNKVSIRCDNTEVYDAASPDGFQYCFETTCGFFVARHNGFVFITGNSGKSHGCEMDIPMRCAQQSVCADGHIRNRCLMARGTYQELKQTTFNMWMHLFPTTQIALSSPIQGKLTMKLGNRLSVIDLIGFGMDMASIEAKLRSNDFSIAFVNEAQYVGYPVIEIIQERLGRYPYSNMAPLGMQIDGYFKNLGLTADTNAPVEGSWLYERAQVVKNTADEFFVFQPPAMFRTWDSVRKVWVYEENRGQRLESHGISAAENVENLNEGWEYYWKLIRTHGDDYIRRNVLNEYGHVLSGTPVFPEFSKDRHVYAGGVPMPPRGTRLFCGMDLGRTPRAVFGYYSANGGVRIPLILAKDCGVQMFAETVMRPQLAARGVHPSQVTIFPDPAGENLGGQVESTDVEILRACGFNVTMPVLKNNDPFTRVETVRQSLTRSTIDGDPYVLIDPSAEELIRALAGGYTYAVVRQAGGQSRTSDKPDKNSPYSHVADAMQYLMVGLKYGGREDRAFGGAASASFADRFRAASDGRDPGLFC